MAAKKAKTKKQPQAKTIVYAPIPNVITLSKQTGVLLWSNRAVLGGIAAIYGLLVLLFVRGLGRGFDVAAVRDQFSNKLAGSFSAYTQLLGSGNGSSQSAGSYQVVLFVIASLALIWALRQLLAGEKISVKNAYYYGMYPLVPFLLVIIVLCLQLVPMAIGSSLYSIVVSSGIAANGLEIAAAAVLALALMLVSLYLIAPTIMALYIVTLVDMTPHKALRSAKKLAQGRRWTILRKILFLPVAILIIEAALLTPLILIAPLIAGWVMFLLGVLTVAVVHAYLYNLYRTLLHEA